MAVGRLEMKQLQGLLEQFRRESLAAMRTPATSHCNVTVSESDVTSVIGHKCNLTGTSALDLHTVRLIKVIILLPYPSC